MTRKAISFLNKTKPNNKEDNKKPEFGLGEKRRLQRQSGQPADHSPGDLPGLKDRHPSPAGNELVQRSTSHLR